MARKAQGAPLNHYDYTARDQIRSRIVEVMSVFPRLSPAMLQVALGPRIGPGEWRPIMETLIAEGIVHRHAVPTRGPKGNHVMTHLLHYPKGDAANGEAR